MNWTCSVHSSFFFSIVKKNINLFVSKLLLFSIYFVRFLTEFFIHVNRSFSKKALVKFVRSHDFKLLNIVDLMLVFNYISLNDLSHSSIVCSKNFVHSQKWCPSLNCFFGGWNYSVIWFKLLFNLNQIKLSTNLKSNNKHFLVKTLFENTFILQKMFKEKTHE